MSDGQRFSISKPELSSELVAELEQLNAEKRYRTYQSSVSELSKSLKDLSEKVKEVDGFWAYVLASHPNLAVALSASSDQEALSYLSNIEVKQNEAEPRPFELVFHFKENPFFSNTTLSKKYELRAGIEAIKDGKVTPETFSEEATDLKSTGTKINWKSEEKNLCAKHPRKNLDKDDSDDWEGDMGSFWWFFAEDADPLEVGRLLRDDILPDAYDFFTGEALEDSDDEEGMGEFDELDEEDDEDDEGSIDLDEEEQPKKKKPKH